MAVWEGGYLTLNDSSLIELKAEMTAGVNYVERNVDYLNVIP